MMTKLRATDFTVEALCWICKPYHVIEKRKGKKKERKKEGPRRVWKFHLDAISLVQVNKADICASLLAGTGYEGSPKETDGPICL